MAMAKVPQTLISIAALFVMVANMALSQTISFQIETFTNNQNELGVTYEGDATVPSGTTFLRLTEAETYRVGRVLYNEAFQFWGPGKQVEFETTIYLQISPTDNTPADGIVFFIAPEGYEFPNPPGSSGGNLGIFGPSGTGNSIFAVELDTYQDPWDPYYRHIGIDINSRNSSSFGYLGDSVLGKEVAFSIKYDVAVNTITAKVLVGSSHHYEATYVYDLSTLLPQIVQVGISAATGASVSVQDINAWEFTAKMKTVDGAGIRQVVST